ncbi:MAG TPA: trigger factor [Acidimicrobiales bacterium]|nr:trigger factor [Acidimicrobiales bacterium]
MKTTVEPLEGNKVKLSVELDATEFEEALDDAFRRIAREVRIPGFRPGKAPRRLLESRIGIEAAREEALRHSLPEFYTRAVRTTDVDPIAQPEIDITSSGDSGAVAFDAVVEVRPTVSVAGYQGLQVVVPAVLVTDEEIDAQIDRLRNTFAELSSVERPARDGDSVSIDLHATVAGERSDDLSAEDLTYEVGAGTFVDGLDEVLRGAKTGDIVTFDAEVPGYGPASFRVLLKDVKEKLLPEVTDEWASDASEFSTVEELRSDIRQRLETVRKVQAAMAIRDGALRSLVELVTDEAPEVLVQSEMERQVHELGHRLEAQRVDLMDYLAATGQDQEEFVGSIRAAAIESVKADLALRALAEAESIEVSDEDVEAELERMAERYGAKPSQLRRQLEQAEQMPLVRSDIRKGKALAWLVENVATVDDEGRPVDRADLEIAAAEPESSDEVDQTDTDQTSAEAAP